MNSLYKKVVTYGAGNIFAWYSYTLFMPFLFFISREFFPLNDDSLNMIIGFTVFGCGIITRPIGSYIFGRIGDKICTEKAIGISFILLAISTISIAIIPSYEKCGIFSSVMIILARALQGIAMGGAANISMIQLVEIAPATKKGLIGCIPNASGLIGLFITNIIFSILYFSISDIQSTIYWRIPFLFGLILIPFALIQFRDIKTLIKKKDSDIYWSDIKKYRIEILCTFILTAFSAICYYSAFAFLPNYMLSHFGYSNINIVAITNIVLIILVFLGGHLSDKFGMKRLLFSIFYIMLCSCIIPIFISPFNSIKLLIPILGVGLSVYYGVSGAFLSSLFPENMRCTAVAFTMSISQAVFGGTISLISTKLTSYSFVLITLPLLLACLSSIFILLAIK